jgi:hypothetical protein
MLMLMLADSCNRFVKSNPSPPQAHLLCSAPSLQPLIFS